MKRLLALSLLLLAPFASAAPVPEAADVPLPKGLPPRLTTAKMTRPGELVLTELVPVAIDYTAAVEVIVDGKKTIREERRMRVEYQSVERTTKLAGLEGYDGKGAKLSEKALANALRKRTVVAVSLDNKPVDPVYLGALRPGTVVLVFRPSSAPPARRVPSGGAQY